LQNFFRRPLNVGVPLIITGKRGGKAVAAPVRSRNTTQPRPAQEAQQLGFSRAEQMGEPPAVFGCFL